MASSGDGVSNINLEILFWTGSFFKEECAWAHCLQMTLPNFEGAAFLQMSLFFCKLALQRRTTSVSQDLKCLSGSGLVLSPCVEGFMTFWGISAEVKSMWDARVEEFPALLPWSSWGVKDRLENDSKIGGKFSFCCSWHCTAKYSIKRRCFKHNFLNITKWKESNVTCNIWKWIDK